MECECGALLIMCGRGGNNFLPLCSGNKVTAILLCVVVVAINLLFVITTVMEADLSAGILTIVGEC